MMFEAGTFAYYQPKKGGSGVEKVVKPAARFRDRKRKKVGLLWGDQVYIIEKRITRATVSAKGYHLDIPLDHLMENPILSMYQIDCGQGDGALVHFPDGRWMMVDGGPPARGSNSGGVTAVDFLKWKLFVDQSWRKEFKTPGRFRIDSLVCSHPDEDHFGGFEELLPLIKGKVLEIGTYFHGGLGRFKGDFSAFENGKGFSQLGPVEGTKLPEAWLTRLIDGFPDVKRYLEPRATRPWHLSGNYAKLLKKFLGLHGSGIENMQRVDHLTGQLPGYADVKVLGPIQGSWNGKPAIRYLDSGGKSRMKSPSLTRNGQSVVLRIDYKDVRLLLTGDLNFRSQAILLQHHDPREFECHVAKACHHGSEDISWKFCQAMNPLATLFSSGDNESYSHPRAKALGLAAAFSRKHESGKKISFNGFSESDLISPLIYSTELSRSAQISKIHSVYDRNDKRVIAPKIQARGRTASSSAKGPRKAISDWLLADQFTYGLINVRTDGKKVVIGVRKENDPDFQTETFTV